MSTSEFSYIPESPEQSFGNNKGIFTPTDIYDLTRADKYTNYGQLELIETQTVSGVTTVDFTSIKEDEYGVHLLIGHGLNKSTSDVVCLRFYENGVLETGSVYKYGYEELQSNLVGQQIRSTAQTFLQFEVANTAEDTAGYNYFYKLGDNTSYSYQTSQYINDDAPRIKFYFGGGSLPQNSIVDGFRLFTNSGNNFNGVFSLYGLKFTL